MNACKLALGGIGVLGLLLGGLSVATAQKKDDKPGQAKDGKGWTIVIKKVEVMKTNPQGEAWDVNDGKPDLAVIIRNVSDKNSPPYQTKTEMTDTFEAAFNETAAIKCQPGHTLEFEVVDRDVAVNDSIGKISKEHKEGGLKEGVNRLENFGRVVFLEVELKKQ